MDKNRAKGYLKEAELLSLYSKCRRRKVGCVLVREDSLLKDDYIIARGFNGNPTKHPGIEEDWSDELDRWVTRESVLHAEEKVVAYCARKGIPTEGAICFLHVGPCLKCARLLIEAGIKVLYYTLDARAGHEEAIPYLEECGVKVYKI